MQKCKYIGCNNVYQSESPQDYCRSCQVNYGLPAQIGEEPSGLSYEKPAATEEKHPHYFRDIRGLQVLDIYRLLELYEVTDPVFQHVAKKALCAGNRGHKELMTDVNDMIDSLQRWKDMREEDLLRGIA